jgi:putative ABC transport system permease protein
MDAAGGSRHPAQITPGAPGADDDFAINQREMMIKQFTRSEKSLLPSGCSSLAWRSSSNRDYNIMFVSVAERTKEIGIRKAIGETADDFDSVLIEAAAICLFGGLIGLAVAWGQASA